MHVNDGPKKLLQPAPMLLYRIAAHPHGEDAFERFASAMLPSSCDDALVARLRALAQPLAGEAGDRLLEDTEEDRIVFLAEGATKLAAHASSDREQVVAFHFTGDLVPFPARAAHAYALCALLPSALLVFPAAGFLDLARDEPAMLDLVLRRALTALHRSREKAVALGRKTAPERVAGFLVSMATRIGEADDDGCTLHLPMSRRDIADSLGLTIETISRQFGELRDLGLIETSGRSLVRLRDVARLEQRAAHLSAA